MIEFLRRSTGFQHRHLFKALLRRDIALRYQGSVLGWFWAVAEPLGALFMYTFVFVHIFQARWPGLQTDPTQHASITFAVMAYTGLSIYGFFADVLTRSTTAFTAQANYVTKVVFPLAILPLVTIASASVQLAINLGILLLFGAAVGLVHLSALPALVLVLIPVLTLATGLAFAIASLTVYLRDTQQVIRLLLPLLLFLSPVFYPIQAMPAATQVLALINPIGVAIEAVRNTLTLGAPLPGSVQAAHVLLAVLVLLGGVFTYQRSKAGFADVL